ADFRDAAGAAAADALLRRCTSLMRDSIRVYDVLGRGREGRWILLLARSEVGDALQAGERMRAALAQLAPGDEGIVLPDRITASGAVVAYPEDGGTAAALLAAVEGTLAEAGRLGGYQSRLRG